MGLDMYAYKVRKLTEKEIEKIKNTKELIEPGELGNSEFLIYIPKEEIDDEAYSDLAEYGTELKIEFKYINTEKIMEDNDLKDTSIIGGFNSPEEVGFSFENGKRIIVSREEIEKKYIITELEERIVLAARGVGYWRKCYDLEDLIYDDCDKEIENQGYYKCNKAMINDMIEYGGLDEDITDNDDIFYYEWY